MKFQKYFEHRVETLLKETERQSFFVFRGFLGEQVKYLMNHERSILRGDFFHENILDVEQLHSRRGDLGKGLLLANGHLVGIYEELISILSVMQDPCAIFSGRALTRNSLLRNLKKKWGIRSCWIKTSSICCLVCLS